MAPARRRHARARSVGPLASTSTVAGLLALLATPEFWLRLLEISVLNLFLSGDNAVVIALAVRVLPKRQRLQGQIWGTVGAVGLRMAFVGLVSAMLRVPFLRLGGGCALLWIAYRLVRPALAIEDTTGRHGASFWEAIWIIVAADVTMSLDNVLAIAAAAHDDYFLIVVGIAMSIPIVVWGSGHLARLMNRFPWIIWAGGALLGWVAGEMLLEDPAVLGYMGHARRVVRYAVPLVFTVALFALGWWLARRAAREARLHGMASAEAGNGADNLSPRP
jgi:YjbE family integral membrane protein